MAKANSFWRMDGEDLRRITGRTIVNIVLSQLFVFAVLHAAEADALVPWGAFFAFICPLLLTPYFTWKDVAVMRQLESYQRKLEQANESLNVALSEVKELQGLLPICASCKKIRNDEGTWDQLEAYLARHSKAEFTHSFCPECRESLYGKLGRSK
jgi:hypothetical protein